MLIISIVLVNILIAQLSNRYAQAEKDAAIQYDIDKAMIITRLENSRVKRWVSETDCINVRYFLYTD